jgi:hypothetical protein
LWTLLRGTFENNSIWKNSPNPLERCLEMSGNGLFLEPSDYMPDTVICEFCRLELSNWEVEDVAYDAHKQYNPDCHFITYLDRTAMNEKYVYSRNVGLGEEQLSGFGYDSELSALHERKSQ